MFGIRDAEMVQEVVRRGGFRAAAQALDIAPSAVSARIALLEGRLGIKLFDRSKRQVRLTAEGRRFLEQADRLVALRDRIVAELSTDDALAGVIRIGVAETVVHTFLPAMLRMLHTAAPRVRLELSVETSSVLSDKLVADEVDVAVLMRQLVPSGAVAQAVGSFAIDWYAAPSLDLPAGPLGAAELARFPVVTFSKGTLPYHEVERLFADPDFPTPLLHGSASLSTVLHLVRDGLGLGTLPVVMAEPEVAAARLRRVETRASARLSALDFSLCHLGRVSEAVVEIMIEAARSYGRAKALKRSTKTIKRRKN